MCYRNSIVVIHGLAACNPAERNLPSSDDNGFIRILDIWTAVHFIFDSLESSVGICPAGIYSDEWSHQHELAQAADSLVLKQRAQQEFCLRRTI